MRVHDQSLWQQQCAEWARDENPMAMSFGVFVRTWADMAEAHLSTFDSTDPPPTPIEALRYLLDPAEAATERWSIGFIGQALLLLCTHWAVIEDRPAFLTSLNPIERHLFLDAKAVWELSQQLKAQEAGNVQ